MQYIAFSVFTPGACDKGLVPAQRDTTVAGGGGSRNTELGPSGTHCGH